MNFLKSLLVLVALTLAAIASTAADWQSRDSTYNNPIAVSTTYTASGPTTGVAGAPSTNFTVTLGSGTFTGSQTITIADGSSSGVITPNVGSPGTSTVVVTPTAGTNNFSFTYKARQNGIFTLTFTNAQGWTNPAALAYTATETYNVSGPASGPNAAPSTAFTVTLAAGATFTGSQTITIADGAAGGTITPSVGSPGTSTVTVTPTALLTGFTFTYTPASVGTKTLTFTNGNGSGFTDPAPLSYISNASPLTQIMDPSGAPANSNAPTVLTTTATVPIGSLVLFAAYPSGTAVNSTITSVTDQGTGGSNVYTIVPVTGTSGVAAATIAYVASTTNVIPSGTTFTATTQDGSQYNPRGVWYTTAYSGGRDTSGFVITASTATTVAGLSTGTLANAADLVFGYVAPQSSTSGSIVTPSAPWALVYNNGHTHFDYALPASASSLGYAPTWTTASNYSAVLLSFKPTYVGPGDVVASGWLAWHGLRAFSAATRGAALVNVCNSTGGVDVGCADMFSDPATGTLVPATISSITCPGANCTVKTWYDQTGHGLNPTQATVSARATLGASCIGTLPCATGVDIVNGIYSTVSGTGVTASVPWSMTSVVFWASGANATVQAGTLQAQTTANERLRFVATTNLAGFECGTPVTQAVTANNWFAMTGVCNGASGIFAVNSTTNTSQNAGSDALTPTSNTYTLMRKSVGKFVEGGVNSAGFSTGTITSLHANERGYWGF